MDPTGDTPHENAGQTGDTHLARYTDLASQNLAVNVKDQANRVQPFDGHNDREQNELGLFVSENPASSFVDLPYDQTSSMTSAAEMHNYDGSKDSTSAESAKNGLNVHAAPFEFRKAATDSFSNLLSSRPQPLDLFSPSTDNLVSGDVFHLDTPAQMAQAGDVPQEGYVGLTEKDFMEAYPEEGEGTSDGYVDYAGDYGVEMSEEVADDKAVNESEVPVSDLIDSWIATEMSRLEHTVQPDGQEMEMLSSFPMLSTYSYEPLQFTELVESLKEENAERSAEPSTLEPFSTETTSFIPHADENSPDCSYSRSTYLDYLDSLRQEQKSRSGKAVDSPFHDEANSENAEEAEPKAPFDGTGTLTEHSANFELETNVMAPAELHDVLLNLVPDNYSHKHKDIIQELAARAQFFSKLGMITLQGKELSEAESTQFQANMAHIARILSSKESADYLERCLSASKLATTSMTTLENDAASPSFLERVRVNREPFGLAPVTENPEEHIDEASLLEAAKADTDEVVDSALQETQDNLDVGNEYISSIPGKALHHFGDLAGYYEYQSTSEFSNNADEIPVVEHYMTNMPIGLGSAHSESLFQHVKNLLFHPHKKEKHELKAKISATKGTQFELGDQPLEQEQSLEESASLQTFSYPAELRYTEFELDPSANRGEDVDALEAFQRVNMFNPQNFEHGELQLDNQEDAPSPPFESENAPSPPFESEQSPVELQEADDEIIQRLHMYQYSPTSHQEDASVDYPLVNPLLQPKHLGKDSLADMRTFLSVESAENVQRAHDFMQHELSSLIGSANVSNILHSLEADLASRYFTENSLEANEAHQRETQLRQTRSPIEMEDSSVDYPERADDVTAEPAKTGRDAEADIRLIETSESAELDQRWTNYQRLLGGHNEQTSDVFQAFFQNELNGELDGTQEDAEQYQRMRMYHLQLGQQSDQEDPHVQFSPSQLAQLQLRYGKDSAADVRELHSVESAEAFQRQQLLQTILQHENLAADLQQHMVDTEVSLNEEAAPKRAKSKSSVFKRMKHIFSHTNLKPSTTNLAPCTVESAESFQRRQLYMIMEEQAFNDDHNFDFDPAVNENDLRSSSNHHISNTFYHTFPNIEHSESTSHFLSGGNLNATESFESIERQRMYEEHKQRFAAHHGGANSEVPPFRNTDLPSSSESVESVVRQQMYAAPHHEPEDGAVTWDYTWSPRNAECFADHDHTAHMTAHHLPLPFPMAHQSSASLSVDRLSMAGHVIVPPFDTASNIHTSEASTTEVSRKKKSFLARLFSRNKSKSKVTEEKPSGATMQKSDVTLSVQHDTVTDDIEPLGMEVQESEAELSLPDMSEAGDFNLHSTSSRQERLMFLNKPFAQSLERMQESPNDRMMVTLFAHTVPIMDKAATDGDESSAAEDYPYLSTTAQRQSVEYHAYDLSQHDSSYNSELNVSDPEEVGYQAEGNAPFEFSGDSNVHLLHHSAEPSFWGGVFATHEKLPIDSEAILKYKKVIEHGGTYGPNTSIVLLWACHLPSRKVRNYAYVMEHLFRYVTDCLELLADQRFSVVYFNYGREPPATWLHDCYMVMDTQLGKTLDELLIVHPAYWFKAQLQVMGRQSLSKEFYSKIRYMSTLGDLTSHLPDGAMEFLTIPRSVREHDSSVRASEVTLLSHNLPAHSSNDAYAR